MLGKIDAEIWWALRGSNPRHLPCKGSALPAELNAHMSDRLFILGMCPIIVK
jgi:hypothetical protein